MPAGRYTRNRIGYLIAYWIERVILRLSGPRDATHTLDSLSTTARATARWIAYLTHTHDIDAHARAIRARTFESAAQRHSTLSTCETAILRSTREESVRRRHL